MSYTRSFDEQETVAKPPCMYLRSKAIYVTGNPDPQSPEELGSTRLTAGATRRSTCWAQTISWSTAPPAWRVAPVTNPVPNSRAEERRGRLRQNSDLL